MSTTASLSISRRGSVRSAGLRLPCSDKNLRDEMRLAASNVETSIRLRRIEVSTFDAANRISSRRFLSEQGSLSPALRTLPRREIESDAVVDIFNPFHTLDPVEPAATVRFAFQFQGNQRYDAAVAIQPVLYRPKTKLVVPLRGPFLVYDGH